MDLSDTPSVQLEFDESIYRLSAVKKAAYQLSDRCHAHIDRGTEGRLVVALQSKAASYSADTLRGDFANAVLDYELREQIAEETIGIRNLLLAQAFSAVSLIPSDDGEEGGSSVTPAPSTQDGERC